MDEVNSKLLIVERNNRFLSVLSIGDIQRAILDGKSLETKVSSVLRNTINVCHEGDPFDTIKAKMFESRSEFMPIVNDDNRLSDIIFWDELFEETHSFHKGNLNVPVVIMAGGMGTRLKPITNVIPKPLVPVGEKPIIQTIIENFVSMGSKEFYLTVNYKADMIKYHFDNLSNKSYAIHYLNEPKPLGTAGSIRMIADKINSTFFVSNCDILIDQNLQEVYDYHKHNNNELTIVAALKHHSIPYGTLEVLKNGLLKSIKEKPDLTFMVNTGMYILEPNLLDEIPDNKFFHITELIEIIKNRSGRVGVFPVSEGAWLDIGEWNEYNKTQKVFKSKFGNK